MTKTQREKLLALPDREDETVRYHSLTSDDLAAIAQSRMPETRLGYALQLCCLRYPGRYLRRGEFLPGIMLDHIAEQVGADAEAISLFARRGATRYEQLAAIKQRHGFRDFTRPTRAELAAWAEREAVGLTDGRVLLDRLIERMRAEQIIIPGISVVERMAAAAMHAADAAVVAEINSLLSDAQRLQLDALLSDKIHVRQSRLSWLREPPSRVGGRPLLELLDKLTLVRTIGGDVVVSRPGLGPRMAQMAKEGSLYTAQAFQQMGPARRHTIMMAALSELGIALTDGALTMFQSLVGRANLRARKRLEETIAASAEQGRTRLTRIADVLDALVRTARKDGDIKAAVTAIAALDVVEADAAIIRRTIRPGRPDVLGELSHEHRVFKQIGARLLASFTFEGRRASQPLLSAATVLRDLGGDWRKSLPASLPLGHIERRWYRHVFKDGSVDRTYYELVTFFALSNALASGDVWVPTSRIHRSLDTLLTPASPATNLPPSRLPTVPVVGAETYIEARAAELDAALLATARGLSGKDVAMFTGGKLRFPKEQKDNEAEGAGAVSAAIYRLMPRVRITDMLDQVDRWTGFTSQFGVTSRPVCHPTTFAPSWRRSSPRRRTLACRAWPR